MGPTRIIILIVAAVCSIGLAFLVVNMMGPKAPPPVRVAATPVEKPMSRVLVAQRDLKVGERVSADMLGWQPWPPEAVNESFITDGVARTGAAGVAAKVIEAVGPSPALTAVEGSVIREPILAHEPIVQRKLVRGGQGGYMSVLLQPGMRAMSIPVTVESGAGGFVLPNDRVDVILNQKVDVKNKDASGGGSASASVAVSRTVMRNLRVLAIDQATEPAKGAVAIVGATATLEVPAADVEVLAAAKTQGDLMLTLRAYTDGAGASGRAQPIAARSNMVRVYRAGEPTDVMVQQ
jgi:pilus assembly protein CpaB